MSNKLPEFGFNIARILDCGFSFEEATQTNEDSIGIGYGMTFAFSVEENWVQFNIRTDFTDILTKQLFLTGTVLTRFGVNNLSAFEDGNKVIQFPPNSLEMMFGIAFSHMRAIMAKNTAGSKYSNLIIPVINPNEVFQKLWQVSAQVNPSSQEEFEEITKKAPKSKKAPKKPAK